MNFDQSTGIIEMFMDSLEVTDEGTFTFNLVDGKAKGTTSLVLIGDGKIYNFVYNRDTDKAFRQITLACCDIFFPLGGSRSLFLTLSSALFRPMMIRFPASRYFSIMEKKMTACSRMAVSHLYERSFLHSRIQGASEEIWIWEIRMGQKTR